MTDYNLDELERLQKDIHRTAVEKGWWEDYDKLLSVIIASNVESVITGGLVVNELLPEDLFKMSRAMLVVSEISEGVEALRCGNAPDDKLPQFDGFAVELADAIIRILDLAGKFDLPVIEAMLAKTEYNKSRSYKHGGKSI